MAFLELLYQIQGNEGRLFLHEQTASSKSTLNSTFKGIQAKMRPITVTLNAAKYKGVKRKIVKMMTNSPSIAERFSRTSATKIARTRSWRTAKRFAKK